MTGSTGLLKRMEQYLSEAKYHTLPLLKTFDYILGMPTYSYLHVAVTSACISPAGNFCNYSVLPSPHAFKCLLLYVNQHLHQLSTRKNSRTLIITDFSLAKSVRHRLDKSIQHSLLYPIKLPQRRRIADVCTP